MKTVAKIFDKIRMLFVIINAVVDETRSSYIQYTRGSQSII